MTRSHRTARILLGAVVTVGAAVGMAGTALADTGSSATGRILQEGAAGSVSGSYIVVLKTSNTGQAVSEAGSLTKRYGGAVTRSYTSTVKGFNANMTRDAATRLAANPAVAYVEQDRIVTANDTQTDAVWGLDRLDQRALPLSKTYTSGSASAVTAYVLDTGVRITHSEFGGRARDGYDLIDKDAVANDCNGHGTHVAATIGGKTFGVAKDVKIVGVRVLDCNGSGSYSQIIAGVDWVTKNAAKPAVANMSLGGAASTALDDAVKRSIAAGVTYAVAAGNDNKNACQQSPARTPAAITVGASDGTDTRASFSNYGTCLDIFGPGVKIISASKSNDTATTMMSGTSMASPHVAGAAALVLGANPSFTPAQVRDYLVTNADANVVKSPGTGSANRLLYTGGITSVAATTVTLNPTATPTGSATPAASPTAAPTAAPTTAPVVSPVPTVSSCGPFTSTGNVMITDLATINAARTVTGCTGAASATSTVNVQVKHSKRGNLAIWLIAPDGSSYKLKSSSSTDAAADLNATYTVNASTETRNGTWKLKIQDVFSGNIGYLDAWTLRL